MSSITRRESIADSGIHHNPSTKLVQFQITVPECSLLYIPYPVIPTSTLYSI